MRAAKINQELQEVNRKQNKDKESKQSMEMKKNEVLMREQELVARRADIESKVERHEDDIVAFRQDLEDKKKLFESLQEEVQSAHYKYHDITNALERLKDKLDAASMDQRELEKQRQNRELLENLKRLFPGVYGCLIDLCEPVHQRYQLALTRVLGPNMDSIVVDSEHTGRDCIQYLKDQRIEPRTFLPLDGIKVYSISEKLRSLGGTCKLLFDCVKYSTPEVKKAVQFACGDTVVCDSMDEAQNVAYGKRERHKTVSLDGTLFRKSGEITGGMSELKKKAKRWDDKEVEKLVRQRDKCLEDLRKVTQTRSREAELRPLESDIKILEMKLKHVQKSKDYEQTKTMVAIEQELEGIVREKERMETMMESLVSAVENREGKVKRLEAKVSAVEDELFAAFCAEVGLDNIRQYEEQNVHAHQERMKRKNEIQNQLARLQNQLEYERSRDTMKGIRTLASTIKKDEDDLKRLQQEEEDTSKRIDAKQEEVDSLKESLQERKKEAEEKELEVKEVKNLLGSCTRDQVGVQKKIAIREGEIEQQRHERHQILKACKMEGVELPLLDGSLDSIEEGGEDTPVDSQDEAGTSTLMEVDSISTQGARRHYAQEVRINIDYSDLPDVLKRVRGQDGIRKKAEEIHKECIGLRASLEKFVGADLKASDRLKDVEDRLRAASDNMDAARKEFNKKKRAFDVVAKTRRDRFQEAFDHVADVIDDTYKKLSNNPGAIAQIHLEDSCEPFSGGINYHIIPPGKRYRTMDQLSGGERTIAALALLFSIHSYQPSPFFVLDEVDASLDNINIAKLANYIKHHTKYSFQCIVISLKEEFYYHSDALVGVYGQPGGDIQVSGIATLDLTNYLPVATPLRSLDNTRESTHNTTKMSSATRDTSRDKTLESSVNETPVKTGTGRKGTK
jgi:structural maintenance of chromosome 1